MYLNDDIFVNIFSFLNIDEFNFIKFMPERLRIIFLNNRHQYISNVIDINKNNIDYFLKLINNDPYLDKSLNHFDANDINLSIAKNEWAYKLHKIDEKLYGIHPRTNQLICQNSDYIKRNLFEFFRLNQVLKKLRYIENLFIVKDDNINFDRSIGFYYLINDIHKKINEILNNLEL
jgi:hypothetical protein